MNREYYCKVGSSVELRDMGEDLREIDEKVNVNIIKFYVKPEDNLWCWLGYNQDFGEWTLFRDEPEGILVDSEDLIDKVVSKKPPKFEVGKWYRLGKWISKFKEIKNNTEFWAESINTESRFYDKNGYLCLNKDKNGYLCLNKYTPKLITDLSEIQQYLPDGHPDKIKEFVLPEKWCIRQDAGQESCDWFNKKYGCHSHIEGNYDFLINRENTNDSPYSDTLEGYTEITLEQFKKYVLKEGKEEVPEKVRKFKLGDTIYLVNDIGRNAPKGSSAKVVGYDDKYVHIEWIDTKGKKQNSGQYYEKDFSLENTMKEEFKIGDWITITGSDINWSSDMDKYIGRTVQITGYKDPKGVTFEDGSIWYWCYEEKHFRRATKEEIPTNSKIPFKVGDWVYAEEVLDGNDFRYEYGDGRYIPIFQIAEICVYETTWLRPEKGRSTGVDAKYCRLCTPEEIASVTKSEESYKVGDYVVITGNTTSSNNKIGDVGVITEISTSNGVFRVRVEGRPEYGNWTRPADLRKARPDEIKDKTETYKDGDWVVLTTLSGATNTVGDAGVVKESNGTSFRVHVPGKINLSNWTSARNVRKALPYEIPCQLEYVQGLYHKCIHDEPKSLLDREEIEVTIKKTVPKQFNIF